MSDRSIKHVARLVTIGAISMSTATAITAMGSGVANASMTGGGPVYVANSAQNPFPFDLPTYCNIRRVAVQSHRLDTNELGATLTTNVATCRASVGEAAQGAALAKRAARFFTSERGCSIRATTIKSAAMRTENSRSGAAGKMRTHHVGDLRGQQPLPCGPRQGSVGRGTIYDGNSGSLGSWQIAWEAPSGAQYAVETNSKCSPRPNGVADCQVYYSAAAEWDRAYNHIYFYWTTPGAIDYAKCGG